LSGAVWLGNPDTTPLINGNSSIPAKVLDPVMAFATQLYEKEGKAKSGDWFTAPKGIQVIGGEVYPSWYNKAKSAADVKLVFDKVSKKKASDCTPDGAKIELAVSKSIDPTTKNATYLAPDGYDATKTDDFHKCGDLAPNISGVTCSGNDVSILVSKGTNTLQTLDVSVNGANVASLPVSDSGAYSTNYNFPAGPSTIVVTVTDIGFYTNSVTKAYASGNCAS
jgi:hypothetical protein